MKWFNIIISVVTNSLTGIGITQLSNLRMPAPVLFSIVGDVPLLRILRGSGMDDMNVRDGWDITIAVAYC